MTTITSDSSKDTMEIGINEEYAKIFPVSKSDYRGIKESIKADGQKDPIVVNQEGVILDGHTRFRICIELGLKCRTRIEAFDDVLLEKKYIYDVNLFRRNLNFVQRIRIIVNELQPIETELAKRRQSEAGKLYGIGKSSNSLVQNYTNLWETKKKGRVIDICATKAQVSSSTYHKVRELIKNASPEVIEKLSDAKVPKIDKEYNRFQKDKKREELRKEAVTQLPQGFKLIHGDCREKCKDITDSSIHLIFTDPPYEKESVGLYRDLAKIASRVLREGASLITYAGHHVLPEIFECMKDANLTYWWILAIKHNGAPLSSCVHGKHVYATWKPLLWFVKGKKLRTPSYIKDFVESQPSDKALHEWEQSPIEAEHCIEHLTVEGDVVLDPLMGTGTTGIAALNLRRQFIGIEMNPERFELAKVNVAKHHSHYHFLNQKLKQECGSNQINDLN